ncbi:hypothetical protein KKF61_08025 [Patescibacteria group bacterium]|nr:hypothetical protein [Patescibacteria group bacterium]
MLIKKVNPYGLHDKALNKNFLSDKEREGYLKEKGFKHADDSERDKHRTERLAHTVNEERRKQGLKPKTEQELVGNSRKIKGRTLYFYK